MIIRSFDVRLAGQAVVYMANLPLDVNIQNQVSLADRASNLRARRFWPRLCPSSVGDDPLMESDACAMVTPTLSAQILIVHSHSGTHNPP